VRARRAPQIGDVFAVRTSHAQGISGRVVSTSAIVGPIHGCALVYVYHPGSARGLGDLLLSPMATSRAPWSRGYFEFVQSVPLLPGDFMERHCFRDARGALYDEESRPVAEPFGPIGEWRLFEEVEAIDAAIGEALGRSTR